MARWLLLAVISAGDLFIALTDPLRRMYTLAQPLQDQHWPTGTPITLLLDWDTGERAYYLPADIVRHYYQFPAWMSDYYWRLVQAGVMGLMLAGYNADEAMVISSWIDITCQALKESGYEPR